MARPRERKSMREFKEKSEFDQKILDIRRTARVVAGGRRFSFRAAVVVGNRKGKVGFGTGKGADVSEAVEKGVFQARKNIVEVRLTEDKSILHEVRGKTGAAKVLLKPALAGRGLIAGGPIRVIAGLAGVENLSAKILGRTANKLNNARATMEALKKLNHQ